jgi:hypothetical protein
MSRFEPVAKICRRWQRRYKRKGFGHPLGEQGRRRRFASESRKEI